MNILGLNAFHGDASAALLSDGQLVAAVEQYFRDAGCRCSDLKIVNVRTELHEMYHRWGYADTGTGVYDDPTPTKIPVHFINMSKPLE